MFFFLFICFHLKKLLSTCINCLKCTKHCFRVYFFNRYGDLSIKQNYYEFTSVLANTEFCKYLSISYNEIKSQNFECYYDVYNYICSKRLSFEGTQYWVEKSPENIVKISQLIDNYPSSKYIYIKRCIYDIVLSKQSSQS